ncbi:hypothetical protein BDK51DRAFT_28274 [Blyttiomyces helicus]|uniref:Glutamine synthetase C-terminal domain-containing protein n=1 Tax=Blyttiomyces helicus TaxID=388810 RepID=A0A4V1IRT8_9FUNG|nr:hypothetical protein BDK51DRAFT_28274 [Blyttiomyces helicus]|eukprot:RKO91207.1 hypothetical protein BDK51DRAFT_28274 [Blyttiomyces helicus]
MGGRKVQLADIQLPPVPRPSWSLSPTCHILGKQNGKTERKAGDEDRHSRKNEKTGRGGRGTRNPPKVSELLVLASASTDPNENDPSTVAPSLHPLLRRRLPPAPRGEERGPPELRGDLNAAFFAEGELKSRFHNLVEKDAKHLLIKANTLKTMVLQGVLPTAFSYRKDLTESLVGQKTLRLDFPSSPKKKLLDLLTKLTDDVQASANTLVAAINRINGLEGDEQADAAGAELTVVMEDVSSKSDA